jgi:hypothetical protein
VSGSARARANRVNGRSSTGPKTVAGKSRVAKNALRHGLAMPTTRDPSFSGEVERFALVLAGQAADPARLDAAHRIAEAQIDLLRVGRARHALFTEPATPSNLSSVRSSLGRDNSRSDRAPLSDRTINCAATPLGERVEAIAAGLARLDRYERRALSRRKAAIREFDLQIHHSKSH